MPTPSLVRTRSFAKLTVGKTELGGRLSKLVGLVPYISSMLSLKPSPSESGFWGLVPSRASSPSDMPSPSESTPTRKKPLVEVAGRMTSREVLESVWKLAPNVLVQGIGVRNDGAKS